jgi:hypothetical protein
MDQRLRIGVDRYEINTFDAGLDHTVDGVRATAPDAYNLDLREVFHWQAVIAPVAVLDMYGPVIAATWWKHDSRPPNPHGACDGWCVSLCWDRVAGQFILWGLAAMHLPPEPLGPNRCVGTVVRPRTISGYIRLTHRLGLRRTARPPSLDAACHRSPCSMGSASVMTWR